MELSIALVAMSLLAFIGFKSWVELEREKLAPVKMPTVTADLLKMQAEVDAIRNLREDVERCKLALRIRTFPVGQKPAGSGGGSQ